MDEPPKLLIIDDEREARHSLACYLEDCDYRIVEACDGVDGMEKYVRERPDLVLTDLRMPNLDGFGVISAVKKLDPRTPIIVFTGDSISSKETLRHGAFACIPKPIIDMDGLATIVGEALASRMN